MAERRDDMPDHDLLWVLTPRELLVLMLRAGTPLIPPLSLKAAGRLIGRSHETIRVNEERARAKLAHPVVQRRLARTGGV